MLLDLTPLKRHRDFRYLFLGQLVSDFGGAFTYVALPYQIYQKTQSSMHVGAIGLVQLVPLLIGALLGGALADSLNRRTLLIASELALTVCSVLFALTAFTDAHVFYVYFLAAAISVFKGFHRPALDALTPRLVPREDLIAVSALASLRGNLSRIGGPAVAGISIAALGLPATYLIDAGTFLFSLATLFMIRANIQAEAKQVLSLSSITEGLRYCVGNQVLIGTYAVDMAAMLFGMPLALFPAIAQTYGSAWVLGALYSSLEAGALIATLFSGWTKKVKRHGAAVAFAAGSWGLAIVAFGLVSNIYAALFFLILAGAADMVSALFRLTIWNEIIPSRIRGRMAGIEMISYMSGPMLGHARAGFVAGRFGVMGSIVSGGALCVAGVAACSIFLPQFWKHETRAGSPP